MISDYVCFGMCTWVHVPAEAWHQSCSYWKNLTLFSQGIGWTRSCGGGGLPPHLQGAIDFQNRRWTPGPSASPRERHHGRPLLHRANAQAPRAPRTAKPRVGSRTLTPTPKYTNSESSPCPLGLGSPRLCSLQPSGRRGGRGKSGAGRPNRRESRPERSCPRVSQLPVSRVPGGSGLPKAVGGRAGTGTVTFHPQGTLPSRRRFPRPGAARGVGAGLGAAGRGTGGAMYPGATG